MYLIYYVKDGNKGWYLSYNKELLERWANNNLDTSEMSGEDEYEIIDLCKPDLQNEINLYKDKLNRINQILKEV